MTFNDYLEYAIVALGALFVWFESRNNILCWPIGIVQSGLAIILTINILLYSEAILYGFYVVMGVVGWTRWKKQNKKPNQTIQELSLRNHVLIFLSGVALAFILDFVFSNYTDADKTQLDAFTTSFSIIGTFLLIERILSNWIYWIVLNGTTVYLYFIKDVEFLGIYYIGMTLMSIYGLYRWFTLYKAQKALS